MDVITHLKYDLRVLGLPGPQEATLLPVPLHHSWSPLSAQRMQALVHSQRGFWDLTCIAQEGPSSTPL
jgi:hypothetical protein